jgi:hypothetical protein
MTTQHGGGYFFPPGTPLAAIEAIIRATLPRWDDDDATQTVRQLRATEDARRLTIDGLAALDIIGAGLAEHLPGPTRLYLERSADWRRVGEGWFRRQYSYE